MTKENIEKRIGLQELVCKMCGAKGIHTNLKFVRADVETGIKHFYCTNCGAYMELIPKLEEIVDEKWILENFNRLKDVITNIGIEEAITFLLSLEAFNEIMGVPGFIKLMKMIHITFFNAPHDFIKAINVRIDFSEMKWRLHHERWVSGFGARAVIDGKVKPPNPKTDKYIKKAMRETQQSNGNEMIYG
ncbi:MAG: hypothetical protein ACTSQI_07735 [Candidatus Helarchaeota archaeon]